MDQLMFDKHFLKSNVICCESLVKLKQYVNILQFESCRLSSLQHECNQLLDQFYILKDEFEFLVNEALAMKYMATDIRPDSFNEYIYEFTLFVRKIWQVGKHRFSEKGKKAQYVCIIGSLLSDVMSTVEIFVEELRNNLMFRPSHADCAVAIQSISSQIYTEMQEDCLGSAAACLKQYVYLKMANPFLQELNGLIHHYLVLPEVHTPKQFVDKFILNIPSFDINSVKENSEEMVSFQFIVDLLNGKLFEKDVLDHNSHIRPIAEDDINVKNNRLVLKTAEWIMAQYKLTGVPDMLMNPSSSIVPFESIITYTGPSNKCTYGKPISTQSPPMFSYTSGEVVDQYDLNSMETMNKRGSPMARGSPMYTQRKYSPRRSQKYGSKNVEVNASDLQPIDFQLLQTPLLFPLI